MKNDTHYLNYYPSYNEIKKLLENQLKLTFTNDQIRYYIRSNTELNLVIVNYIEQNRINSFDEEIDAYYDKLKAAFNGIDAKFVYNLDDVGGEEYGDAQKMAVCILKYLMKIIIVFMKPLIQISIQFLKSPKIPHFWRIATISTYIFEGNPEV